MLAAACEEVEHGRATSKSLRHVSKNSQTQSQPHIQIARRSQRQQQQQQRQLKDKQLQAEKLHTARISAKAKTPASATLPSSTRSSSKAVACTGVSCSKGSACVPGTAGKFPSENALEREASKGSLAKESIGITVPSRKGKGSPSAGVKKQTSPVGKGSGVSLGLGGRFPLRVRKNVEQLHAKGDLNGKFAQVTQNRGLGDLAKHMAASHASA